MRRERNYNNRIKMSEDWTVEERICGKIKKFHINKVKEGQKYRCSPDIVLIEGEGKKKVMKKVSIVLCYAVL